MITRYAFMKTSTQENGVVYPDCLSLDLNKFSHKDPTEPLLSTETAYYRPDIFLFNARQTNNMDDIILWLSNISSKREMFPGVVVKVPSESDINNFYLKNRG